MLSKYLIGLEINRYYWRIYRVKRWS